MPRRHSLRNGWLGPGLAAALVLACSPRPAVLLLAREHVLELNLAQELQPMVAALRQAGYRVDIATESGRRLQVGQAALVPDVSVAQVDLGRYMGLVVPCLGAGGMQDSSPPALVALVHQALAARLPIAAQYSGIDLLVLAGNLGSKRIARNFRFAAADTPPGVVLDGNLVTSGTCPSMAKEYHQPDGTAELMARFTGLLKSAR